METGDVPSLNFDYKREFYFVLKYFDDIDSESDLFKDEHSYH